MQSNSRPKKRIPVVMLGRLKGALSGLGSREGESITALSSNAEEAEVVQFYEDLQDVLELTPKKRCRFHYRGLECKSRKSRNTWTNRQIWPWNEGETF